MRHPTLAERNLVMVQEEGRQALDDFVEIANRIEVIAPDVEVFIVSNLIRNSASRKKAARRPTLVFSPGWLKEFSPLRGRVYQGRLISKIEQIRLLAAAGVPTPRSAVLEPGMVLDPAEWGSHAIIKPLAPGASSTGVGIQVMRAERVRYRTPEDYPERHPGRAAPMMVQSFIDTGRRPRTSRVLTLFGEPLFAHEMIAVAEAPPLDSSDEIVESAQFANNAQERTRPFVTDPAVLDLARRTYQAAPDIPLMGVDIIRHKNGGELMVLEFNSGGNTWHFSSDHGQKLRHEISLEQLVAQFGAWDTAARVLIERTRAEAE